MNDFNKGELQIILLEMNISIQRTPKQLKVSPIFIQLRDKIESMIDNYSQPQCDHRPNGHYYNKDGTATAYPTEIYKCKYCDKLYKCLFENGNCIGFEELMNE